MIESLLKKPSVMFKLIYLLACTAFSASMACAAPAEKYSIIPEPEKTELKRNATRTLKLLSDKTSPALGKDAYQLTVTPQGVHLSSGGKEGRIYGLVTLQQLQDQLAAHPEGIPCGVIKDKPRYPWRGMMVDPARHFIPIKDLKKFVDLMAYYKFNKLQLHLTDDQGWRLPVPGYPKLKSISSKRAESFGNGTPHEGMYTRQELKDLVAYCAARGKKPIVWYEKPWAQASVYRKGDTVFTWRMGLTPSTITETKKQGLPLIIAAGEHCYLDYPQIPGQDNRGWMPTTTLEQSYKLNPAYGRPEQETDHIIGVQATMWAEQLPTLNHLLYRTYPRACAIAEAGWSPMNVRSWENFQRKLADQRQFVLKRFNYDMERTKENEPPFK